MGGKRTIRKEKDFSEGDWAGHELDRNHWGSVKYFHSSTLMITISVSVVDTGYSH